MRTVRGRDEGPCPEVDLEHEKRLIDLLVTLAEKELLASAHDISDGGLAVALAECAMTSGLGLAVDCETPIRISAFLFGETTGRAVVSLNPKARKTVIEAAEAAGVPIIVVGVAGGERFSISVNGRPAIDEELTALDTLWRGAFRHAIEAADVL